MDRNLRFLITGLLLIGLSSSVSAQRGRGSDSTSIHGFRGEMRMRQMPHPKEIQDTLRKGMRPGYGYGYGRMAPGSRGEWVMPFHRIPYGYGPGYFGPGRMPNPDLFRFYRRGFIPPAMRPGTPQDHFIYRIPDLTDKQKKELDSIRDKFSKEMDKFLEENRKKAEVMRKSHLEKINSLLTPEQKKWLEERTLPPAGKR